jgi:hypothetical protein
MKFLILLVALMGSSLAFAQAGGDADSEGKSEFKLFSKAWSPTFYSLASAEQDRIESKGGRISTYNYFSFHTFIGGPYRFSLRLPFTFGTAGTDDFNGDKNNKQEFLLQDTILEIRNPELAYIPGDIGLYWAARVYLPVSKQSRNTGQIARFRNHVSFNKMATRWLELTYENRYYYSWQSRTAYELDPFTDEMGFEVADVSAATKQHEVENWLHILGRVAPRVKFGLTAITEDSFYNKSDANNKYKKPQRFASFGPGVHFPFGNSVNFIFSYQDKVDRDENLHELGQFQAKNAQYILHSFVTF